MRFISTGGRTLEIRRGKPTEFAMKAVVAVLAIANRNIKSASVETYWIATVESRPERGTDARSVDCQIASVLTF